MTLLTARLLCHLHERQDWPTRRLAYVSPALYGDMLGAAWNLLRRNHAPAP